MDKEKLYRGLHRFRHPVMGYPTANGALIWYDMFPGPKGIKQQGWYTSLVKAVSDPESPIPHVVFVEGTKKGPFGSATLAYRTCVYPSWIAPNEEKGL